MLKVMQGNCLELLPQMGESSIDLVWRKSRKGGFLNAKNAPLRGHENVLVFYKKAPIFNPQKTTGHARKKTTRKAGFSSSNYGQHGKSGYDSTERYPDSILEFKSERGLHPTQKPVTLMQYLIETYSNPGDVVLDFCAGSGTVGIAALNTARMYLGIEKDPEHCEAANERLEKTLRNA